MIRPLGSVSLFIGLSENLQVGERNSVLGPSDATVNTESKLDRLTFVIGKIEAVGLPTIGVLDPLKSVPAATVSGDFEFSSVGDRQVGAHLELEKRILVLAQVDSRAGESGGRLGATAAGWGGGEHLSFDGVSEASEVSVDLKARSGAGKVLVEEQLGFGESHLLGAYERRAITGVVHGLNREIHLTLLKAWSLLDSVAVTLVERVLRTCQERFCVSKILFSDRFFAHPDFHC